MMAGPCLRCRLFLKEIHTHAGIFFVCLFQVNFQSVFTVKKLNPGSCFQKVAFSKVPGTIVIFIVTKMQFFIFFLNLKYLVSYCNTTEHSIYVIYTNPNPTI